MYRFLMKCMVLCATAHRVPAIEARTDGPRRVWEPFPDAYAWPECPTTVPQSIWQLLFFDENHDFPRFSKIFWKSMVLATFGLSRPIPGWTAAARSVAAGGARDAAGSVCGVAVGGPEAGGMLGMLSVMYVPIIMSIGGP